MTNSGLRDFVSFLASGSSTNTGTQQERKDATYITFAEFRDFLMLLPRKASVAEIYKCKLLMIVSSPINALSLTLVALYHSLSGQETIR